VTGLAQVAALVVQHPVGKAQQLRQVTVQGRQAGDVGHIHLQQFGQLCAKR